MPCKTFLECELLFIFHLKPCKLITFLLLLLFSNSLSLRKPSKEGIVRWNSWFLYFNSGLACVWEWLLPSETRYWQKHVHPNKMMLNSGSVSLVSPEILASLLILDVRLIWSCQYISHETTKRFLQYGILPMFSLKTRSTIGDLWSYIFPVFKY